ncbi:MAG: hypothetical protein AAFR81_09705 [Chloroflexota bacterium]
MERIRTLHPSGKQGVNIDKTKYDTVANTITDILREGDVTFSALTDKVGEAIGDDFDGSVGWYVTTVKLDLEARGTIERIPNQSPQVLRLSDS